MRVVVVIGIIHALRRVLFGVFEQEVFHGGIVHIGFVVAGCRHHGRIQQIGGSGIKHPVPLFEVFAAVHHVAGMDNEFCLRI